jgi:prepilin-type N-terminal cleavage/methylation domain-containing protein
VARAAKEAVARAAKEAAMETECVPLPSRSASAGFSLLEVLLAVGILSSISVFAITALSNQLEIRNTLSRVNEQQHAIHSAMSRVFDDVRHAYVLSKQDLILSGLQGKPVHPRLFGKGETFWFSTHALRSMIANTPESNIGYVRYSLRDDPKESGKKQLMRAVDQTFKESIERNGVGVDQVLIGDVREFKLGFWNGQDFTPEWDTNSSETGGKLPKMVKVKIAAAMPFSDEEKQKQEVDPNRSKEPQILTLETIVYLLYSSGQADVKDPAKEYRWQ